MTQPNGESREQAMRSLEIQGRVLASMREGVSVSDDEGIIVYTNAAEDAMFGYGPGELIGQSLAIESAERLPDHERFAPGAIERVRTAGEWSGDRRNRRRDGSHFVTQARVNALELDGKRYWVCVQEDVTEWRHASELSNFLGEATAAIGQSLDYGETLRTLTRVCVPFLADYASVDMVGPDGAVERVSTTHVDPAREVMVRELWSRYQPRPNDAFESLAAIRSRVPILLPEVREHELQAFAQDAEQLALLRTLHPRSYIRVPLEVRGEGIGALSLAIDGDTRRYTEDDLVAALDLAARAASAVDNARLHASSNAAREEAERANRAKSDLLAHASHDLRTPLNAIGGYAELLEMGVLGPITGAQQDALSRIQRSQRQLLALINDLLNLSKLRSGSVHFDLAPVDLSVITENVVGLLAPSAEAKSLGLKVEREKGIVAVADEEKVTQILLNVLRNAVKFTDAGGSVVVTVSRRDHSATVKVQDTGIGIAPTKLEAIFEPFTQVGRSFSRPLEGSGLGLAISRELTKAMSGELVVSSELGAGSTFTLSLPLDRRHAVA